MIVFIGRTLHKFLALKLVYAEREDILADAELSADVAQMLSFGSELEIAQNSCFIECEPQFFAALRHRDDDEAGSNQT